MILGEVCTRNCEFCAVTSGFPFAVDEGEPERVAHAAKLMNLRYVVLTSVTRDDLEDGGAGVWTATLRMVREHCPQARIEALVPDFMGLQEAWEMVFATRPDILNHNVETVQAHSARIRPQAQWARSLNLLKAAKAHGLTTKSGIMLGLGEEDGEVADALAQLKGAGVDILTLGQYLRPGAENTPVKRMVEPEEFAAWKTRALKMGFKAVEAGPLVRSSYHAGEYGRSIAG
jgi:lipoic acid synthetase